MKSFSVLITLFVIIVSLANLSVGAPQGTPTEEVTVLKSRREDFEDGGYTFQ